MRSSLLCLALVLGPVLTFSVIAETTMVCTAPGVCSPVEWDADSTSVQFIQGRRVIRYSHSLHWGAEGTAQTQFFYVGLPEKDTGAKPPLVIYLHSAGGDASHELEWGGIRFVKQAGPEFILLAPNCKDNQHTSWWWGWNQIEKNKSKYAELQTPVEQRILATIEWVVNRYSVDRNRIYLCGLSMGGSGALGIGLARGDIFAAIRIGIAAGTGHGLFRMNLPDTLTSNASAADQARYLLQVSGHGYPDAPPIVNFFSQTDYWSQFQPRLLRAAHDGRHSMLFAWGPWGHDGWADIHNPAAAEFRWMDIRRDQAYPVFTNASSDQPFPGYQQDRTQYGQQNAYFRWKNLKDTPDEFSMELRLVGSTELIKAQTIPAQSIADVTLRRVQQFTCQRGVTYTWTFSSRSVSQSGSVQADLAGLVTVPQLVIKSEPAILTVRQTTAIQLPRNIHRQRIPARPVDLQFLKGAIEDPDTRVFDMGGNLVTGPGFSRPGFFFVRIKGQGPVLKVLVVK